MENQTNQSAGEAAYEVVWPLGKSTYEAIPLDADRISDLNGKTIGELWNGLFKGNEMFPLIREKLQERYPAIKFVDYRVFGNTFGRNDDEVIAALPDMLHKLGCDAVVSGVGN